MSNPVVAIVGATGAVGVALLQCLEDRNFPRFGTAPFGVGRVPPVKP